MVPEDQRRTRGASVYDPEVTILKWSSSMLRRRPKTFAVGIAAVILGLAAVYWGFQGQIGAVILAAVLLGGALGPLYVPTVFTLTNKKAYQQVFFSRDGYRWQEFDGYRVFEDGLFLHLRPSDLRMRYLKGLMVFFGPANRQEVLDIVRQNITVEAAEASSSAAEPGLPDKK